MKTKRGKTKTLPLLPLRDMVVFPNMIAPLFVGRKISVSAAAEASALRQELILATQRSAAITDPLPVDLYDIGVAVKIQQFINVGSGSIKIVVEGLRRVRIKKVVLIGDFYGAQTETTAREYRCTTESLHLMCSLKEMFRQALTITEKISTETLHRILKIQEPGIFADTITSLLSLNTIEKQRLLEIIDPAERLIELHDILESETGICQVDERIEELVSNQIDRGEKDYYLKEQLKGSQEEFGEGDEPESETDRLNNRIHEAKLPSNVNEKALQELNRLKQMPQVSAEGSVIQNYIEWLIDIPWQRRSKECLDIRRATKVLDSEHHGLAKVKERIVEFLSVKTLVKVMNGPILCLVGPPGVGKTSLGKSIAKATGRKFARFSVGGLRDEAEIRGHRRTYIGAMPGRIIQMLKKTGTKNPVFMLDEVDKISSDYRGAPASALLEVLDPEQNHSFSDHFLELDFDLSEVMFVATANVTHTIPRPLLDRMEVIRMEGYTEDEKTEIAKRYLSEKSIKSHGLRSSQISFSTHTLKDIIEGYTKESGVRELNRKIETICRKVARIVVEGEKPDEYPVFPAHANHLTNFLGPRVYHPPRLEKESEIGLVNGLAWTETGGEILSVETIVLPGKGELILTGQMGDVMKESARAALGFVRSEYEKFGLDKNFYSKVDIHIHIPEGAIPKDGPSAGITMATAMISALTQSPVFQNMAMTGEITLRGKVLPVGGIKEKLLAAHRAGIDSVLLPENNKKDLKEIPEKIVKSFAFHFVLSLEDVLTYALVSHPPLPRKNKERPLLQAESAPLPVN